MKLSPPASPDDPERDDRYRRHREDAAKRQADQSREGRNIGPMPPVADPARRAAGSQSFRAFCETYLASSFRLAWSRDHLTVIRKLERAVLSGGQFAEAMPRGSGKTTLVIALCLWALLIGARRYVCLIAATAGKARELLDSLKTELECNELLAADFPEVVYPIACLERIHNRCRGQTSQGEATRQEWRANKLVLPTIAGSQASGSVLTAVGLTGGNIRGQIHKLPSGEQLRPDLAVIDDPQTRATARSVQGNQQREQLVGGDVLGMAGPGAKLAAVMCCTVIQPGDMVDRILDRKAHPEWQGERTKLIDKLPTNMDRWEEYARLRSEDFSCDGDGSKATEYYGSHRVEMDAGADVPWPERHNDDELSAIQNAMNLFLFNRVAFFAEYQNDPQPEASDCEQLRPEQVAAKCNRLPRGTVPADAAHLVAFGDVHKKLLYWIVVAWTRGFAGHVVDYETWPDQRRRYFTLSDATVTMARKLPKRGLEAMLFGAFDALTNELADREWPREGGGVARIEKLGFDANWGDSTNVVYQFCRQSKHASLLLPVHGRFVGATSKPFSEYSNGDGDIGGHHWRIPSVLGKRQIRHLLVDTNYWKSFVADALAAPLGDPAGLTLFGDSPDLHKLLADHACSETRTPVKAKGREVDQWAQKPDRPDNHWWDGLTACAAEASLLGCQPNLLRQQSEQAAAAAGSRPPKKPHVRYFS